MTDNEITREKTFSEELPYLKERMKEVFDNYHNPNGYEDPLYIAVLRDSNRLVRKAEEEIIRKQTEIEQWKEEATKYQNLWCTAVDDIEKVKAKTVKDFAEKLKENISDDCHIVSNEGEYVGVGYDCTDVIHCIDNLVKEKVGKKMNDKEIIKALKCCGDPDSICAECPIKDDCGCNEHLANYALDLITHQQADIDRLQSMNQIKLDAIYDLQAEIEKLKNEIQITKDAYIMLQTKNEIIKSEAVKEFAERLKEKSFKTIRNYGLTKDVVEVCDIDNLVKEKANNEKGESKAMNETFYLFIFADNSTYETDCVVSFKDAILEMAKKYRKFKRFVLQMS